MSGLIEIIHAIPEADFAEMMKEYAAYSVGNDEPPEPDGEGDLEGIQPPPPEPDNRPDIDMT